MEYVESPQVYTSNFVRNSKAVGVLWGVFTICFAIIDIVVFVQPQWIGDTVDSKGTGYFGLWKHCSVVREGAELVCHGRLDDLNGILTPAFRASTVFVGLSVVIVLLCICCMLLFCFFHSTTVFHICGWMQMFSGMHSIHYFNLDVERNCRSNSEISAIAGKRPLSDAIELQKLKLFGDNS